MNTIEGVVKGLSEYLGVEPIKRLQGFSQQDWIFCLTEATDAVELEKRLHDFFKRHGMKAKSIGHGMFEASLESESQEILLGIVISGYPRLLRVSLLYWNLSLVG